MDPNATLRMIGEALADRDIQEAIELREALVSWIRKGGFEPDWRALPRATQFVIDGKTTGV